jgi:multicomponent Na+:H+ antiporter subunit E
MMRITCSFLRAIILRWLGYLALWVALIGLAPLDLVVGELTAAVATWASLRLLPPGSHPLRPAGLPGLVLRFLARSASAGIDVARRAFSPRLPLQPGFIQYRTGYARGPTRNAFASMTSLLPGTVAVRDDAQGLLYHCLDLEQPVTADLAAEEREAERALVGSSQG